MKALESGTLPKLIEDLCDATKNGKLKWKCSDNISFEAELDDINVKLSNIENMNGNRISLVGVIKSGTTTFDTFQYPKSTKQYAAIEEIYAYCVEEQINNTFFKKLKESATPTQQ